MSTTTDYPPGIDAAGRHARIFAHATLWTGGATACFAATIGLGGGTTGLLIGVAVTAGILLALSAIGFAAAAQARRGWRNEVRVP